MNYTANLTEERDELNANLEEAKKALQREMATRIALESKGQMSQGRKVRRRCRTRVQVAVDWPGEKRIASETLLRDGGHTLGSACEGSHDVKGDG